MSDTADQLVILVEDDAQLRRATVQGFELAGLAVRAFPDAESALLAITPELDGVLVSDIRLPRMDGLQLLAAVRAIDKDLPVVLVTGHGDVSMAVGALKQGASDFLTKPFAIDHLVASARRAMEHRRVVVENRRLRAAVTAAEAGSPLIGESTAMAQLRTAIRQLAEADCDVLVEGETGTGKDLVALMLHRQGHRRARPFIAVDCAALPESLAEIELFGHAADSVPHTRLSRDGKVAASSGGTLLLDGVDAMTLATQAKLLRVLEEREVQPIGAERGRALDLRVIATSATDLSSAVGSGRFRADLYHRLALTRLTLPPLRERDDDRFVLFASFVEQAKAQLAQADYLITSSVRARLVAHDWPGNVRELRNFAYDAVLQQDFARATEEGADLKSQVASYEAMVIADALHATKGNVVRALDLLRVPRKTLYDKFARYGINPDRFR